MTQGGLALLGASLVHRMVLAPVASRAAWSPFSLSFMGLVCALSKGGAAIVVARSESALAAEVSLQIRDGVAQGLLEQGAHRGGGADIACISGAVRELEQATITGTLGSVRAFLQLLVLGAVLVWLAPALSLGAAAVLIPFAIALSHVRRFVHSAERQTLQRAAEIEAQIDELVHCVDLWRSYGSGAHIRKVLRSYAARAARASIQAAGWRAAVTGMNEVLGALALVAIVACLQKLWWTVDARTMMAFLTTFFLAYRPLRDWGDARGAFRRGEVALEALEPWQKVASPPLEASFQPYACPFRTHRPAELIVEQFGARHYSARWNFCVKPGSIVALVGPTGAGKTTLLRALLGLEPAEGKLLYGGQSLGHCGVGPQHRPFAWVPQETPLVTGSLEDNLALGREDVTQAYAELAALADGAWVNSLQGLTLGPSGRALSGGERAHVALARALGTGLPVLLLDEPTAHLDEASEQRVLALLARLRGERSIVIVTHRPAPAALADVVIPCPSVS